MNITFERRKFIEYRREHHPMFVNGEYDFDYTLGEFTLSSTQAAWEYWVASAETPRAGIWEPHHDEAILDWCARTVREVADLGHEAPLGDWCSQLVMVAGALKRLTVPKEES